MLAIGCTCHEHAYTSWPFFSQVVEVLSNVGTLQSDHDGGQKFSDAHMRTMFAAIDVDESGYVDW